MKNKIFTLSVIVMMAVCIANAQTWTQMNSGSGSDLKGIYFPSSNVGYAVGTLGTILKTTNSGTTWQSTTSNYQGYWFWDVHFLNADTGFVVGESDPGFNPNGAGIILRTTNGGATWNAMVMNAPNPFRDLFVLDANTMFACGGAEGINTALLKSTNGGTTWNSLGLTFVDATMGGMYFIDNNVGFVGMYESVFGTANPTSSTWFTTTNGGAMFTPFVIPNSISYWNFATDFGDATTGYSTRSTYSGIDLVYIKKTTDGGNTWTETTIPNFIGSIYGLDFIAADTGYIVGAQGVIKKTSDAGATWITETSGTFNELRSVYFPNSALGFAAGANGTILKWTASSIGINENNSSASSNVYPNPNTGKFTLNNFEGNSIVEIVNAKGQIVLSEQVVLSNHMLDISDFAAGVYSIVVRSRNKVERIKVVKE
ncbi:MAG: T9SS type A sorting domain-containing protein [Bacteroidetes bacterium]|nr:T9SS type A sorting domain-containing protein [Bacteroidota bacterium]